MKIAVCDDSKISLNEALRLLHLVMEEKKIPHEIDLFSDPAVLLKTEKNYDIVLLDVEMKEMNGIETAKKLKNKNPEVYIFFVTNYDAYLDDALNQHAFRFWTKPLDSRKLAYGIQCAVKEKEEKNQKVKIWIDGEEKQIPLRNIIYFYMENKRLHIITKNGELITKDTIKKVQEQLKNIDYFCEIARGYSVNFYYVRNYDRNMVFCGFDQYNYQISISRRKYKQFHQSFVNWIGGTS